MNVMIIGREHSEQKQVSAGTKNVFYVWEWDCLKINISVLENRANKSETAAQSAT